MRRDILATVMRFAGFHGRSSCGKLLRPGIHCRRLACEQLEERQLLSLFSVTSPADSGPGSLREAITSANSSAGPDEISFSLAVGSIIQAQSLLPALADVSGGTMIDGDVNGDGRPDIVLRGNSFDALCITSSDNTVRNLVIQNGWAGVHIYGSETAADNNSVLGCYIGTDLTGMDITDTANHGSGVWVGGITHGTLIGGSGPHEGNVIAGNENCGIQLIGAIDATLQGNYIGLGADGSTALGSQNVGVSLESGCQGVTIGGTVAGARNVISGNGSDGVKVTGSDTTGNLFQGNFIGTNAAGTAALGNGGSGVYVCNSDNTIGGSATGQGNRIAFNNSAGVAVVNAIERVSIRGNVVYENGGPGIDLGNNGFSPNDPGDVDTGPNGMLNWPVLQRESGAAAGLLRIAGQAAAGATIDLFQTNNLYGDGDARVYLDSTTADPAGGFTCDVPVRQGGIVATATDAAGNTSEFSLILPTCSDAVDAEYLLITSNALAASFQPLVDRRAAQGKSAQVVTVEWITAHYNGTRPDGTSDVQTAIRNGIKDYYENHGTRWVCLGGDETIVPARFLSRDDREGMPSDFYYASLTGTWDSNANGVYADAGDTDIDPRPQMMVGRIPVRAIEQVGDYVAKVIVYEDADPEGYSRTLLLAGSGGPAYETGTARAADQQDHELISRSEQLLRSQYWQMVQPVGQMARVDDFYGTFTCWDTSQCGDYDVSSSHLLERLDWGYETVILHGHGDGFAGTWVGETNGFTTYDAGLLTNATRPSIFVAVSCSTADFDLIEPSLAEALLRNPNGGAIAYLAGVRTMDLWDTPYPMAVCGRMLGDQPTTLGEAVAWDTLGWPGQRVDDRFNVALLGDPALQLLAAPSERYLQMLSPVNCEVVARDKPMLVRWNAGGTGFAAGEEIKLEYSADSGQSWQTIPGAEALPHDARSFSWDVSGLPNGIHYRVRVTSLSDPSATDASKQDFRIADMGLLTVKMDPPGPWFDEHGNQVWYWIDGNCANFADYNYSVPINDPVTLIAPSVPGYNFIGWSDGQGTVLTHQRTCNFTFSGDITAVAAYQMAGAPKDYYVNDDTAENGDAPGNDENDGLSPQAPMRHIQALLDRYFDVATIHVFPGVYQENVTISGDHSNITLDGAGADVTIIDGNQTGSCLTLNGVQGAAIRDLTVRNGKADYGGGIHVWDSGLNTFSGNTFEDNNALCGGAFFAGMADVVLDQNTFDDNDVTDLGGAVYLQGANSAVLTNNTFRRNTAQGSGGAIYAGNTPVSLSGSQIQDNSAAIWAGGAFFSACTVAISGNTIIGNTGNTGIGGIHLTGNCTGTVTGNTIAENWGPAFAGGIDLWSSNVTIADNVFQGNSGQTGGLSVRGASQVTLIADVFSGNTGAEYGGAVYLDGGANVLLERCQVVGNAAGGGGAVANFGQLTARNCTVVGNAAVGGGALLNAGTATIANCTLAANVASERGGALYSWSAHTINCRNTIVWGNTAPTGPAGYLHWQASMSVGFCDVENGQAGIVREAETVFDWQAGNIDANPLFARDPNDGGDGWGDGPATLGIDESANDDYGDLHLQATSPCVDAGDPTGDYSGQTDMDGQPRVQNDQVDIGADEVILAVVGRHVFYNNSKWDGHAGFTKGDPAANEFDDRAIATDKTALLPGQTGTFANYTSYPRGINGIMVDIQGLADPVAVADGDLSEFDFRYGNDDTPGDWPPAPTPLEVTVRDIGGGVHRITFVWADNAIPNKNWVQVTVKQHANTGLTADDVFYFGNTVGENTGDFRVDYSDAFDIIWPLLGTPLPIGPDHVADINRDGRIDYSDVFDDLWPNLSGPAPLKPIHPPALPVAPLQAAESVFGEDLSWQVELIWFDQAYGSSSNSDDSDEDDPLEATAVDGVFSVYYEE